MFKKKVKFNYMKDAILNNFYHGLKCRESVHIFGISVKT